MKNRKRKLENEQTRQFPVRVAENMKTVVAFVNLLDDLDTEVFEDMEENMDYYIESGQLVICNEPYGDGNDLDVSSFTKRPTKK